VAPTEFEVHPAVKRAVFMMRHDIDKKDEMFLIFLLDHWEKMTKAGHVPKIEYPLII
jgi:hypothetical protein